MAETLGAIKGPAGACTGALHVGGSAGWGAAPVHCMAAGRGPAPVHLAMAKPCTGALQAGGMHRCTTSGTRQILLTTLAAAISVML